MDLSQFIRPVIFTTGWDECVAAFFGSGFLVRSATEFYFVTARHVLTNHQKSLIDLRIPAKLGSNDTIPLIGGWRADIGQNNSFEDMLVIHLDSSYCREHRLEDQFWPIGFSDDLSMVGQTAIAFGFPQEEQELDFDNNMGSYCPVYIRGTVSSIDRQEQMITVATLSTIPLTTFNQLSGGALFAGDAEQPQGIFLAGVILQGERNANILHALGSTCIFNLIRHFEETDLNAVNRNAISVRD